jgi:hypothetical protein
MSMAGDGAEIRESQGKIFPRPRRHLQVNGKTLFVKKISRKSDPDSN